ncbi:MAG: NADH-quinone oxidoreductase subunit C [Syntrophobacteraceae bacterium]|jgi:NADH-quinone oxidoreductase subunit C|nr:NADH-quinone oxidoreductase subunit C [Syntrophobacteraceae bacterium]
MAKTDDILRELRAMLPEDAVTVDDDYRTGAAFAARVPLDLLRDAAERCSALGFYLETITGLDFQDTFELVYHFNVYEPKSRIALRVLCGHDETPPTVRDILRAAEWFEREVHEFFGIRFADNPDLRRLLLPEDADYYPLRKTFGVVNAYRKREEIYA